MSIRWKQQMGRMPGMLGALLKRWFGSDQADPAALEAWRAGLALYDSGDHAAARLQLERAIALVPAQAEWQNEYGLVCMALGDREAACAAFRRLSIGHL